MSFPTLESCEYKPTGQVFDCGQLSYEFCYKLSDNLQGVPLYCQQFRIVCFVGLLIPTCKFMQEYFCP
jgi:hypothetical protein